MYPLEYACSPYWPPSASSIRKRPLASTSAPRSQRLLWISPFSRRTRLGSGGAGVVAARAPARIEPLAASDALGECLKRAVEDWLARDDPRRDRHTGAAPGQIRGDRKGRPLRVGEPVMTLHRLGIRLKQRHHATLGRRQRPVLWEARRPSTRLIGIVVTRSARDRIPTAGRALPPLLDLVDELPEATPRRTRQSLPGPGHRDQPQRDRADHHARAF